MLKKEKSRNKKDIGSKKSIIITVVFIIVAISSSFLIYFALQVSLNTSTPIVVVSSPSMSPNINTGDLLFVRGIDPVSIRNGTEEDKNGDVIIFSAEHWGSNNPGVPIVHRVIDKWNDSGVWKFKTKGDANSIPDVGWVSEDQIYGVVIGGIPYIGWVKIILTDSGLLIPLIVLILFILVVSMVWDVYKEREEKKNPSDKENSEISKSGKFNIKKSD